MDDWHGGEGTAAGSLLYPVSCLGSDRTDCGGDCSLLLARGWLKKISESFGVEGQTSPSSCMDGYQKKTGVTDGYLNKGPFG